MINILQDSVNIAQIEQQDLQQKLKNAVSSYKDTIIGDSFKCCLIYNLKFTVKLLLFQETEKEKLLSSLHEEGKKVMYVVFNSKGIKLLQHCIGATQISPKIAGIWLISCPDVCYIFACSRQMQLTNTCTEVSFLIHKHFSICCYLHKLQSRSCGCKSIKVR